jgi:hypothetical protein
VSEHKPLEFSYDEATDVLTIDGMRYHGGLFRAWAYDGLPPWRPFVITERSDGLVTFQTLVCRVEGAPE